MKKRPGRRRRSLNERFDKRRRLDRLLALAAEEVPLGSGRQSFGRGPYVYWKIAADGSTRIFRFRSKDQAAAAQAAGARTDVPLDHESGHFDVDPWDWLDAA